MKLVLEWHKSIDIGRFPYNLDLEAVPCTAGVYIFLRTHGDSAEALYVGKAGNLCRRVAQQLNNLRLMQAIKNASNGTRRLVFAEWLARPGQQMEKALPICEKTLIRYYLAQGHGLVNVQGSKIDHHELSSKRQDLKSMIPVFTKMVK